MPEIPIGINEAGVLRTLPLRDALRHTVVCGPTGCGKTGWLVGLIASALKAGVRVCLIDPKGDAAAALRDEFLPVLGSRGVTTIRPEEIVTITAFRGAFTTPLNPLQPIPGLAPSLQAHLVARLLAVVLNDSSFGIRMEAIATRLIEAALEVPGSTLAQVRRMITDDTLRRSVGEATQSREIALYLEESGGYDREPTSSKEAVRARLDALLRVPQLAESLCAPGAVPAREFVEAKLTVIDLGDPPQGSMKTVSFLGGFLWQLAVAGVFSRPSNGENPPTLLVIDEAPVVFEVGAEEAERVLSMARSRGIGLLCVCQTLAQIRHANPLLLESLRANVHRLLFFRPTDSDLKELSALVDVTGEAIDPKRPDRLLSPERERRAIEDRLRRLPERHFLHVDLLRHDLEVLRTPDVPFADVRTLAAKLPSELRAAYARGKYGVRRGAPSADAGGLLALRAEAAGAQPVARKPTGKRPKLVLP